jgi:hypothetical protein
MNKPLSQAMVLLGVGAALLGVGRAARATLIVIPNSSFETPDVADGGFTDSDLDTVAVPSWHFTGSDNGAINAGVWDPQNGDYAGTNGAGAIPGTGAGAGTQIGYIYLEQNDPGNPQPLSGILETDDSLATVANNTRYDLTVALGNAKTFDPDQVSIQMFVDGEEAASQTFSADQIPEGTFTNFTTSFTTDPDDFRAGGSLSVRILHTTFSGSGLEADFDNVRLTTTAVPEPVEATLASLGICGLALRRRRRSR